MEKTINYLIDLFSWVQVASILLMIQVVFLLCSNKVKIKDK